jgi:NADPH:quinone reductase-like Zn-dependent oxidoreductase
MEISGTAGTGRPVCALLAGGGHAEAVAVPEGQIFPAPRALDLVRAAAIPEAFLTAFVNLVVEAALREGEALLVHAGASGVGLAAIALGKLLGARVAATTRTPEKIPALLQAGADLAIDTSSEDFADAIERHWGASSVGVVLDPVGAAALPGDLRLLATGGRVVFLATMSGSRAELDIRVLMGKRARLIGSTLRSRSRAEKARLVERFEKEVLPAFDAGRLRVAIDSVYAPENAVAAFTRMRENRNIGKILIDWGELTLDS